jgi:hypothetical protein
MSENFSHLEKAFGVNNRPFSHTETTLINDRTTCLVKAVVEDLGGNNLQLRMGLMRALTPVYRSMIVEDTYYDPSSLGAYITQAKNIKSQVLDQLKKSPQKKDFFSQVRDNVIRVFKHM